MNTDWIVVKYDVQPAIQKCLRCGSEEPFPFGKSFTYTVDLMKAFIKEHKRCKEPKKDDHA